MAHVISQQAEKVFRNAIARIPPGQTSVTIGEHGGAYMPLHVELIGKMKHGTPLNQVAYNLYSFAHYSEQNGDLMCDPDMVLEDIGLHGLIPTSYQQDYLGIFNQIYDVDEQTGLVRGVRLNLRQDLVKFANMWAKNLHEQQGL